MAGDRNRSDGADAALGVTAPVDGSTGALDVTAPVGGSTAALDETAVADGSVPASPDDVPLEPGAFGHFEILRRLGAGGMGVVYLARDQRLDREVAIKVHSVRAGELGFDRLQREATAMARLSHPNVIHVYEVGTVGDRLFIVMEYMRGGTLGRWLGEKHSLREVLDTFAAAGAGLAAAHDAGLIHRDFKPENVFIAEDGRVTVADFGLARAVGDIDPDEDAPSTAVSSGSLDSKLTMTGAAVGTPAFMAPEQFVGNADERADQFAFCVALHEAVCGNHPFGGSSAVELRDRALTGAFQAPAADRRVPGWLRRVLRRGLAAKPEDRYPSMHALLDAIRRGRRRLPVAIASAAAITAMIAVGATTWAVASGDQPEPCGGAADRLAGAWDEPVRRAIAKSFAAVNPDGGSEMFDRAAAVLDGYASDWVAMRVESCRATRVRREQSEQLMDLRVICLDRRRDELAALTELFAEQAGPEVVATSVEAASKLTPLDQCADAEALLAAYPPPDETMAGAVASLRARIDRIDALAKTGQYKDAVAQSEGLADEVAAVGYPPLEAEALLLLGQLQKKDADIAAEATLQRAATAAARARDDRRLAQARVELVRVIGHLTTRYDEALAMVPWAETSIVRAGDDAMMHSELEMHRGSVLLEKGQFEDALAAYQHALKIRESVVEQDDPRLGVLLNNTYIAFRRIGDLDRARELAIRSRRVVEAGWGPSHPDVGDAINNLAIVNDIGGNSEAALAMFREARQIWATAYGDAHPRFASATNNVGIALLGLGRFDQARIEFERAYEVWRAALGEDHPRTVSPLNNLGMLAAEQGQWRESDRAYGRARAVLEKAHGDDSPHLTRPLSGQAEAALQLGDKARARALCTRIISLLPAGDPRLAEARACLARAR